MNMPEATKPVCYYCNVRSKSLFGDLNLGEVTELDLSKTCGMYKKGQKIFEEGAYPHGLYCVNNGKVKIVQAGVDGKEQIIHLAKNGDIMGYRAILSGDKYSCSAIALEPSSLCFIPSATFLSMIEKDSSMALKVIQLLSTELKNAENTITNFAQKSVKERLAQSILLLKESYGFEEDGRTIDLSITREELANIVGTARETVTRLLLDFNKNKSIELIGKKIRILDQEELIKVANVFD